MKKKQPLLRNNRTSKKVLYLRVDGGVRLGMGHLFKTSILASELRKKWRGLRIIFFVKEDKTGFRWLKKKGYHVIQMPSGLSRAEEPAWLLGQISDPEESTMALDILNVGKHYVSKLKREGLRVITFENCGQSRRVADLTINALVEGPRNGEFRKKRVSLLKGARYRVFHPDYKRALERKKRARTKKHSIKTILVTLGGGDDKGFDQVLAKALLREILNAKVFIVEGPAKKKVKWEVDREYQRRLKIFGPQKSLANLLVKADIAITAGGGTLYELALMGVPAIAFSKVKHQEKNIRAFKQYGTAVAAGSLNRRNITKSASLLNQLLLNTKRQRDISIAGRKLVDGLGTERVVKKIIQVMKG